MKNSDDTLKFGEAIEVLRGRGFEVERPMVKVENPTNVLKSGIEWYFSQRGLDPKSFIPVVYTSSNGQAINAYTKFAEWLADNNGKSLLLYGGCGLGKTMLACYILPQILYHYSNPRWILHCYSATELHKPEVLDEVMKYRCVCIDDIGAENKIINYGQTRDIILELVDATEKEGKLVVFTTNLSSGSAIEQRYGTRVFDRIKSNFSRILFRMSDANGNQISLRPK